ncbi:MAG TPA: DUF4129 domain-containing protein [Actinocrinis sp.]|nr:DUF4129 domain-containing protein [Actinocrinis sp.]
MPSTGPIRPSHRGLLLASALLGLAAGTVGLAAASGYGLHQAGPVQRLGILVGIVCFGALIGLALNYSKWRADRSALTPQSKTSRLRTATAAILFAGAVLVPILIFAMSRSSPSADTQPLQQTSARPVPTRIFTVTAIPTAKPTHGGSLNLLPFLIGLGVLVAVVVLVLVLRRLRQMNLRLEIGTVSSQAEPGPPPEEQVLADAMSAGRRALQGDDARAAIIACYAAMEQSLAVLGLARGAADSPADLLNRARTRGLLQGSAPQALTALFREARFSVNPMGEQQMAAARDALEQCAAQLRQAQTQSKPQSPAKTPTAVA